MMPIPIICIGLRTARKVAAAPLPDDISGRCNVGHDWMKLMLELLELLVVWIN